MTAVPAPAPHVEPADIDAVRTSLGRCLARRTFFDEFYRLLFETSPRIAHAFRGVNMERQKRVIEDGVLFMVMYARGSETAQRRIDAVARSHGPSGLDVDPKLYRVWLDVLCQTVRRFDPACDHALEAAWRRTLQVGIDRIIEGVGDKGRAVAPGRAETVDR